MATDPLASVERLLFAEINDGDAWEAVRLLLQVARANLTGGLLMGPDGGPLPDLILFARSLGGDPR